MSKSKYIGKYYKGIAYGTRQVIFKVIDYGNDNGILSNFSYKIKYINNRFYFGDEDRVGRYLLNKCKEMTIDEVMVEEL